MSKEYTTDNIYIDGYLSDGSGSGTTGQVLSSTGGGVSWINGSGIAGGPYLPLAGGTMTGVGGVIVPDNFKWRFGTGNDLEIYHSSNTNSNYISALADKQIIIGSNNIFIGNQAFSESYITALDGGAVNLFYNNSKKFETTSSGITITGAATATTFLGDLNGTINTATTAVTQVNATDNTTVATTAFVQNLIGTIPAGLVFQGTWNAATNTPTLASGSGTTGNFYIVSVDGTTNLDGVTDWVTGDWAVFIEQGGTDAWEKIDNSSVLDGAGTGQTVSMWSGSGTSNTLTNAPITVLGNNATFAGNVTVGNTLFVPEFITHLSDTNNYIRFQASRMTLQTQASGSAKVDLHNDGSLYLETGGANSLILDTSSNATFAGTLTVNGTNITVANATNPYLYLNDTNGGAGIFQQSGNDTRIGSDSNTQVQLIQNNAVAVTISTAKNVGIGTTSPGAKLDVQGTILVNNEIQFVDGNMRIFRSGNDMRLRTGGSDKVTIDSSGNVGIGTTSPSQKLTVVGNAYVSAGVLLLDNDKAIRWGNSNETITGNNSNGLLFGTGGSERMRINTSGNVGIGTTAPATKLDVTGTGRFLGAATSGNPLVHIHNNSGSTATSYGLLVQGGGNSSSGYEFYTKDDSGNIDFAIKGDGKVGIGTHTPATKLHILEESATSQTYGKGIQLQRTETSAINKDLSISWLSSNNWIEGAIGFRNNGADGDGDFYISTRDAGGTSNFGEAVTVDKSGNVGIGTTSPVSVLSLEGNQNLFSLKRGTSGDQTFFMSSDSARLYLSHTDTQTGNVILTLYDNNNAVFNSGNVGIGTTSPERKLHIQDGSAGTVTSSSESKLVVESSLESGISLLSPDSRQSSLYFGSPSDNIGSQVAWQYSTKLLVLGTAVASGGEVVIRTGNNSEKMRIDSGGNVGIGTTSPGQLLQLEFANTDTSFSGGSGGDWGGEGLRIENTINTAGSMAMIHLRNNDADIHIAGIRQGTDDSDLGFFFEGNEKVRFTKDGNVGIGTTGPDKDLTIKQYGVIGFKYDTNPATGAYHTITGGGINPMSFTVNPFSANTSVYSFNGVSGNILTMLNGGNVGIGTTSPTAKITLADHTTAAGGIKFRTASNPVSLYSSGSSNLRTDATFNVEGRVRIAGGNAISDPDLGLSLTGGIGFTRINTNDIAFVTLNSEKMRLTSAGNVGIGTTSPVSKLNVVSTSASSNGIVRVSQNVATNDPAMIIESTVAGGNANTDQGLVIKNAGTGAGNSNTLTVFKEDNTTRSFVVQGGGNVGIGTTSPDDARLDVLVSDADRHVKFRAPNGEKRFNFYVGGTGNGANLQMYQSDGATNSVKISTAGNSYFNGGNVGIGTTNPQQLLDVNTNSTGLNVDNTAAIFGNDVGTTQSRDAWIKMRASSQTNDRTWAFGSQQSGDFRFNYLGTRATAPTSGSTFLTIKNTGNVGINNTSPGEKLDVTGNIKGSTTMTAGYTVTTLTAMASPKIGMRAYVTDGTSRSWGGTVTDAGLGGAFAPVMYDGSNWKYY